MTGSNEEESEIEDPEQRAPSVVPILEVRAELPAISASKGARRKKLFD